MRCLAKDRNSNGCRNHAIGDTRFCTFHDYMIQYTDEMIEKSIICSGCNKNLFIKENEKTCDKCRERAKAKRVEFRENIVLCKKDGCKFKRADDNGYCKKHHICLLIQDVESRNKRLCVNYIRGCRTELAMDHPKKKCETCLEKDREKDKQRRSMVTPVLIYNADKSAINELTGNVTFDIENAERCTEKCENIKMEIAEVVITEKKNDVCENNHIPNDNSVNNIAENKNKKSKEEIRENARIRKQAQRKRLVEKYGDAEYRKIHAKQIAENRKNKNTS